MTLYLHFRVICFLLTFLNYASGFAINEYSNPTGYTHENITRGALDRVASIYIATILRPGRFDLQNQTTEEILKQYFEEVPSAGNIYDNAVDDIVKGLEDAEKKVQTSAKYSMNNEMITEGNMYLNLKRSQIESLSTDSSPNWSVVRMVVGDYLYTLQDFYSNTNWVELGGGTLNSLGWNDTLGIPVANDNQPTCKSCHAYNGTQNGACNGNIIAGHVLNSGYIDHSSTGQGGVKVFNSQWANGEGKCSHGGRHDSSRHLPATGGINKETTSTVLSPHYYLHSKAGKMATDATTDFFIRNESSLLTVVGYVRLGKLLGLNEQNHQSQCVNCNDPSLSIVFVIDTTGSMASDIFQVRQKAVEMVTKAMMPGYSPFNYIVVTFNDPASKTTYRVSKDGEEVKRWLNALTVDGGGDCPEYAMSGIKTAMQHARNGSCVFFFTDADPKDPDLRNDVVNLIRSKDLHLVSFITGQCHGQLQTSPPKNGTHNSGGEPLGCIAKSQGHRKKRGFGNFFQSLGGTYIPVKDRDISKPLDTLLEKNMAITYVNIYTTKISSRSLDITVDSHISAFTVEIEDASSKPSSALYRPIGTVETFSGKSSFNDIGRSTYIMSIVSPVPGIWMLKHMNSETWIVTVKQQGDIEFTYQFLEDVHGALLSIHGTPLAGSTLTLLVKVTDLTSDDCLVYGILLDETGTEITRMSLAQSSQGRKRTGIAVFNVPNKAFKIAIEGTEKGNVFKRQSKDLIHPASVSLQILQSDGNLYVDKDSTVISNVTNTGSTDETYQVHFTDTAGFTDSTVSVTVGAGMSKNVSLTIRGRKTHKTTILTTSLLLGGKEIQQQQTVFMVQPKIPPTININLKSSDCIPTFLNYFNCSKELINITATVETSSLNLYYTKPRLDLKMSNSSGKYVLSFR
ncbi:von Willebrand factor A domain-containing protein 7-like [Mytilus trossulus]|uniref:von Willebrand factor A domain-containing protein 7-like n=1 Tax=Mytilus trossulus TaxID=6551 RepID=UPI003007115B